MIFLVEFSRKRGLRSLREFRNEDLRDANRERAKLIGQNLENLEDVEIALFQTTDLETFKETHSRYFKTSGEDINDVLIAKLRKSLPH